MRDFCEKDPDGNQVGFDSAWSNKCRVARTPKTSLRAVSKNDASRPGYTHILNAVSLSRGSKFMRYKSDSVD